MPCDRYSYRSAKRCRQTRDAKSLALVVAVLGLLLAPHAWAQQTIPLPLVRLTAQAAGTVNSPDQYNSTNRQSLSCYFVQSASTGSPSTTFKIQAKEPVSGQYVDLLVSSAITSSTAPVGIYLGAGVENVANVGIALPVPRAWRASVVVTGATVTVTGTVSCQ
jgi:hypothetical protein